MKEQRNARARTSRLMFILFDQKYENIWSFIAVVAAFITSAVDINPVNAVSILINAQTHTIFVDRWHTLVCTLQCSWNEERARARELYTSLRICTQTNDFTKNNKNLIQRCFPSLSHHLRSLCVFFFFDSPLIVTKLYLIETTEKQQTSNERTNEKNKNSIQRCLTSNDSNSKQTHK